MRRSFSSDKLYWDVFREYVRSLMTIYHAGMEFFIEGTRSRSGKAMMPKIGLLSMALEPLFSKELFDVTVVPVGVAYEKPLEENLFAYELLGVPKPKETTKGLFDAIKISEVNHGPWFFNFGKPISLQEHFFGKAAGEYELPVPVHKPPISKPELGRINGLAHKVRILKGIFEPHPKSPILSGDR